MGCGNCAAGCFMQKCAGGGRGERTQGEIGGRRKVVDGRRGRRRRRRKVEMTGKLDMAMNHGGEHGRR